MFNSTPKFKFSWRDYQAKFLDGFEEHKLDNHLHVVAPPGSGKTILGLEMTLRVGKPALILAPTLTIRNQWQDRLLHFFDPAPQHPHLSLHIKTPATLTFSTYQSLYALYTGFDGDKTQALIDFIHLHNISTLVLDEAHHLKNSWWNCLFLLKQIEGLTIIALTATPPYDSAIAEVNRYFDLCGPIDDEIAVPDLITNRDLCPHQDYVYLCTPEQGQMDYILDYRARCMAFMDELLANVSFQKLVKNLHVLTLHDAPLEDIYDHPKFFSSALLYLKASGHPIAPEHLALLGMQTSDVAIPSFSYEWAQYLLQELIVDSRDAFIKQEEILKPITTALKTLGILRRNTVDFIGDQDLYTSLANSPSKLKSIAQILKTTSKNLKEEMRAVVLTDFIRKEFLDYDGTSPSDLNKMGVVSIFQYLMAHHPNETKIGVLTGSLLILHQEAIPVLEAMIPDAQLQKTKIPAAASYYSIGVPNSHKNNLVASVTTLFQNGIIRILIGTKSLLGEGWDAPSINTLILASYVGSFVSSNQMRGRAIRVTPENPNKTSAIWHLACLDATSADGGKDMEKLRQRFNAFSGVSLYNEPYIENGIARLDLPTSINNDGSIEKLNSQMLGASQNHTVLKARWDTAIEKGSVLVSTFLVPFEEERSFAKTKQWVGLNAFKYLSVQVIAGLGFFLPEFLVKNFGTVLSKGVPQLFYLLLAGLLLGFGPKTFKALKVYMLFGNQFKITKKIAAALLAHLQKQNMLTSGSTLSLIAEQEHNGTYSIHLKNANQHDANLFVSILREIIAPIDNPRYLLVDHHWLRNRLGIRRFYVVPAVFGRRKEDALAFNTEWNTHVNSAKIAFTRNLTGRKLLLKARFAHLLYAFGGVSKKSVRWK